MNLTRITTVEDFLKILPAVVEEKKKLGNYWSPVKLEDFLEQCFTLFPTSYCFGEQRDGKLLYFIFLLPQEQASIYFWLFYVDKELYEKTKELLFELKSWAKQEGFTKVTTATNRNQSSYRRWVSKFGLVPVYTTYEGEL
jgi:hypothetical protein